MKLVHKIFSSKEEDVFSEMVLASNALMVEVEKFRKVAEKARMFITNKRKCQFEGESGSRCIDKAIVEVASVHCCERHARIRALSLNLQEELKTFLDDYFRFNPSEVSRY